jgi:hypothetical protein
VKSILKYALGLILIVSVLPVYPMETDEDAPRIENGIIHWRNDAQMRRWELKQQRKNFNGYHAAIENTRNLLDSKIQLVITNLTNNAYVINSNTFLGSDDTETNSNYLIQFAQDGGCMRSLINSSYLRDDIKSYQTISVLPLANQDPENPLRFFMFSPDPTFVQIRTVTQMVTDTPGKIICVVRFRMNKRQGYKIIPFDISKNPAQASVYITLKGDNLEDTTIDIYPKVCEPLLEKAALVVAEATLEDHISDKKFNNLPKELREKIVVYINLIMG